MLVEQSTPSLTISPMAGPLAVTAIDLACIMLPG